MPVSVVTGGASGFGLALVERCAALGMRVAVLDLDGKRAATEAARVADAHGVQALGMAVDVADPASVGAAAAAVGERFGVVDLLVSNVGVQLFGAVETFTDEEWQWVLNVNVVGSARLVRAFIHLVRKAERGRLAFTTSSSILDPASRLAAYQASKFAVWGLAETLRLELADEGIGVTVILPSGMITRHLETSEAAQPDHLRRPIANEGDFNAMVASNADMTSMLTTADDAAAGVIEAVMADEGPGGEVDTGGRSNPSPVRSQSLRGRPTQAEAVAIEHRLRQEAIEAFVENGFEGTTMEAVAAAAGITKRTLYAKYEDKQSLFAGVIPQALADMPFLGLAFAIPDGDLRNSLREMARQIIQRLVDPKAVRLRRLAVLEADRIAELDPVEGADMWSTSLQSIVQLLAVHAETGEIVADDFEVAADLFLAMVAGSPTMWADLGLFRSAEELDLHIERAVDLFLSGILPRA